MDFIPMYDDTLAGAFKSVPAVETAKAGTFVPQWELYQSGVSSWYGDPNRKLDRFHGRKTASGEIFNTWELTVAHRKLPFGTKIRITNTSTQDTVIATVTDRGPYHKGRILDMSYATMRAINGSGLTNVKIEILKGD